MPIYQCKPAYLNWPRAGGLGNLKTLAAIFFRYHGGDGGGGGGGEASVHRNRQNISFHLTAADSARSFVRCVARLFRTSMKINYFVNSCVTLAVTGPSLWVTAAQGAIFQFPMSPSPFANPYFRFALSSPAALSLSLSLFLNVGSSIPEVCWDSNYHLICRKIAEETDANIENRSCKIWNDRSFKIELCV